MQRLLVILTVLFHGTFVLFVVFGGYLSLWDPRWALLHLPLLLYGLLIEWTRFTCPLTPLEKSLRAKAGMRIHDGDFTERYILPCLPLPADQDRAAPWLAGIILGLNAVAYGLLLLQPT